MQKLMFLCSPHLLGQGSLREKPFWMHHLTCGPRFIFKWKAKEQGNFLLRTRVFSLNIVLHADRFSGAWRPHSCVHLCSRQGLLHFTYPFFMVTLLQLSALPSHFHFETLKNTWKVIKWLEFPWCVVSKPHSNACILLGVMIIFETWN